MYLSGDLIQYRAITWRMYSVNIFHQFIDEGQMEVSLENWKQRFGVVVMKTHAFDLRSMLRSRLILLSQSAGGGQGGQLQDFSHRVVLDLLGFTPQNRKMITFLASITRKIWSPPSHHRCQYKISTLTAAATVPIQRRRQLQ